jgi:MFS family permease
MHHFFAFYRALGRNARNWLWASTASAALEAMDFIAFPLVASTLVGLWKLQPVTTGGITSATLFCSSLASLIAGYVSTRFGRRRTIEMALLFLSAGSVLSACAQNATQLLAFRALLGFGFGIDTVVALLILREALDRNDHGQVPELYQGVHAVGWILALVVQTLAYSFFRPQIAWRVMFGAGVLPILLIHFVRQYLTEPASPVSKPTVVTGTIQEIFLENSSAIIAGGILTACAQGSFYAIMTWLPQFLRTQRHISVLASMPYLFVLAGGCFCGYVFGGWLCTRLRWQRALVISAALAFITLVAYTKLPLSDHVREVLGLPLGGFAAACYPALMAMLSKLFSAGAGQKAADFTFNAGRAVGGSFPLIGGMLSAHMKISDAISIVAAASYTILIIQAFLVARKKTPHQAAAD